MVSIGTNKSSLAKIELDLYGKVYDTTKGPNSHDAMAQKSLLAAQKKVYEATQRIVQGALNTTILQRTPFIQPIGKILVQMTLFSRKTHEKHTSFR